MSEGDASKRRTDELRDYLQYATEHPDLSSQIFAGAVARELRWREGQ